MAVSYAVGVVVLLVVVTAGAPAATWYPPVALAGLAVPPVGSLTRARWAALAPDRTVLGSAFSIESLTDDLSYVVGPVLATVLGAVAPAVCPLATVALVLTGAVVMAARSAGTPRRPRARRLRGVAGPLAVPGVRVLTAAYVATGVVFGGLQVGVTAAAGAAGHAAAAGPVYGGFGVASMVSGLAYGAVHWQVAPARRVVAGFGALAVGCALLAAAGSLPALAAAILLPGLAMAPTLITGATLATELAPPAQRTEAYAWLSAATAVGVATGTAVTGRIVGTAPHSGFLVPAGAAAVAAVLVAARVRR
ncbi:MFS transporter [Actinocatenispora rupis]|uniref:Major facilitator superfamily (MFS) profile domain-containing protein n=1 Tax=Actinocatenispora rupis TaxID=519421 RepID=A0A8J3JAP1_9ACTN|nr:MFS transporter [Actinocatenispora rupis]GID13224.1 hypothetical protein Aru02nite_41130 [Actinocatenispora rupis]